MNRVSVEDVAFAPLLEQTPETQEFIRALRNSDGVRKYMYSDHVISPEEHARWLASLRGNDSVCAMVILAHGKVEGLVSLNSIRHQHKTADWAFYLSEDMQGKGVGGVVEFKLLDFAFNEAGLEKLNCEVLEINPKVIEMHQKFGFKLEGTRRANVIKDGQRISVAYLGILREEWLEVRPRFARLFSAS
jgi:UDP-4-amino-4,6-dideoxy-N-acetyl-beta-L-altrosamine N-acetyltransferase